MMIANFIYLRIDGDSMARVTVEDCVKKVQNRFELVALASQRAKDIHSGTPITVERDNDKNSVIALREIAADNLKMEFLREDIVKAMQHYHLVEEEKDEDVYEASDEAAAQQEEGEMEYLDGSSYAIPEEDIDLSDMSEVVFEDEPQANEDK